MITGNPAGSESKNEVTEQKGHYMKINNQAAAGTMESSDAFVTVSPAEDLSIEISSVVYNQYGKDIEACVRKVLSELSVDSGKISVSDKGAIDCVIAARVETAVRRAGGEEE